VATPEGEGITKRIEVRTSNALKVHSLAFFGKFKIQNSKLTFFFIIGDASPME
jgi:hypothetical protein